MTFGGERARRREVECLPLLAPKLGDGLRQLGEGEARSTGSGQPFDNAQGRQDARGVGAVHVEALGEFRHRGDLPGVQHLRPAPRAAPARTWECEHLDETR